MIVLPHDRIFIRLDKTPERDGRTDRQTDGQTARGSTVCIATWEQCGRAVKMVNEKPGFITVAISFGCITTLTGL